MLPFLATCATRPQLIAPDSFDYAEPGQIRLFDDNGNPGVDIAASIEAALRTGHPLKDSDGDGRPDYIILALSGGGAFGAYTAGILTTWSEIGTRPEFDVITGVSTGALAGALAFAGPEYDPILRHVYTQFRRSDILRFRPFLGVFASSVSDDHPLHAQILDIVDDRFLDRVVAEHDKGRRFYVATTDLDRGRLAVWDMGEVARVKDAKRRERFANILLASASVPVLFPPVFVPLQQGGGVMHVDGGVKAPVLVRNFMLEVPKRASPKRPVDLQVYVVINNKISLTHHGKPVEPNIASIARSSIRTLYETAIYKTLYQSYVTTRQARGKFRLSYVPDELQLEGNSLSFKGQDMQRLFDLGASRMREGTAWVPEPPRLEALERIN